MEEKSGVVTCFNSLELFDLPGTILDLHFAAADLRFGHILLSLLRNDYNKRNTCCAAMPLHAVLLK